MSKSVKSNRLGIIADRLKHRLLNREVFDRNFRIHLLFTSLTILLLGCEVRDIDPETGRAIIEEEETGFDATRYVDEIWQDKILPVIREEAVELSALLNASGDDKVAIAERQGQNPAGESSVYLVKGNGRVIEADTTSRVGFLLVGVSSSEKTRNVKLQVGPVISGTALRDALPFISFDQFNNQIEYAAVSRALHDYLLEAELSGMDYAELEGSEIHFSGALMFEGDQAVITPVEIEVDGQ